MQRTKSWKNLYIIYWVYCKIRVQLRFPPTEIHADLQKVYGNGALKYATVCTWVRCFNDGGESIENDLRVGRPVSVLTEENVATVKTLTLSRTTNFRLFQNERVCRQQFQM